MCSRFVLTVLLYLVKGIDAESVRHSHQPGAQHHCRIFNAFTTLPVRVIWVIFRILWDYLAQSSVIGSCTSQSQAWHPASCWPPCSALGLPGRRDRPVAAGGSWRPRWTCDLGVLPCCRCCMPCGLESKTDEATQREHVASSRQIPGQKISVACWCFPIFRSVVDFHHCWSSAVLQGAPLKVSRAESSLKMATAFTHKEFCRRICHILAFQKEMVFPH